MKNKNLNLAIIALTGMFTLAACNEDDDETMESTQNIVQIAQDQPDLSSLVTALSKFPDLVSTLNGPGEYTVFAPTNEAFTRLLGEIGQSSIDDVPEPVLKSLLQYHLINSGAVLSTQLQDGSVPAANNEEIDITTSGGIMLNGSAKVLAADVDAANGVVHKIDQVLVPESIGRFVNTVVEPAYFNKNFTTLVAAVTAASPSILDTLLSTSKKTLFAPANEAFTSAGITELPDRATLDAVLKYHLINGEVKAGQLPSNDAPANNAISSTGGVFYLSNRGSNGVFINGRTRVTTTDITADNGVVHVIDRALMPPAQTVAQIATALSQAPSGAEFTQLTGALGRVPELLAAAASADSGITVFAPTDAAFRELYSALGVSGYEDISLSTLTAVLKHHIISSPTTETGRVFSTDLVTGSVPTLNGNISINSTSGTVTSGNGTTASISSNASLVNVLATNGVIHTIDRVLLPSAR